MRRVLLGPVLALVVPLLSPLVPAAGAASAATPTSAMATSDATPGTTPGTTPGAPSACSLTPLPPSRALTTLRERIASAATGRVRLVALGSSTTVGMGLPDQSLRWPDQLMSGLLARGVPGQARTVAPLSPESLTAAPGARLVDGALPGAVSAQYVTEFAPALVLERATGNAPDIVLHMVGADDYWAQLPPLVYRAGLESGLALLDAQPTQPIHVFISTYRDPARTDPHIPWSAYTEQMRQVAAEDPAHRLFVNLTPWFDAADVPGSDPYGLLDSGGVHPSAAGHAKIAQLLLQALGYGC